MILESLINDDGDGHETKGFRIDRLAKKNNNIFAHALFFFPVTALLRHESQRSFTFRGRREHKSRQQLSFPELRCILLIRIHATPETFANI